MKSRFCLHWSSWSLFRDLWPDFSVVVVICFPHPHLTAWLFLDVSVSYLIQITGSGYLIMVLSTCLSIARSCIPCNWQLLVFKCCSFLIQHSPVCFLLFCYSFTGRSQPFKAAFLEPVSSLGCGLASRTLSKVTGCLCSHIYLSLLLLPGMSSGFLCLEEDRGTHMFLSQFWTSLHSITKCRWTVKVKKLFTVKNNYFNHRMKFTGFRQFAVLPKLSGFTPEQCCIVKSYPTGPLDVKLLLLTKVGVLCIRTLCQLTS